MSCPRCGAEDFNGVCDNCGFPIFQKKPGKKKWIDYTKS